MVKIKKPIKFIRRYKMNHRKEMPKKKDEQVFKYTANKTKKINIAPKISRGGTRL